MLATFTSVQYKLTFHAQISSKSRLALPNTKEFQNSEQKLR